VPPGIPAVDAEELAAIVAQKVARPPGSTEVAACPLTLSAWVSPRGRCRGIRFSRARKHLPLLTFAVCVVDGRVRRRKRVALKAFTHVDWNANPR
jgi:hypothetical protein